MGRRLKHHLIVRAGDNHTLCGLPTYRRRTRRAVEGLSYDTCDACALAEHKRLRADPRGGSAGPMGGPGAGPAR